VAAPRNQFDEKERANLLGRDMRFRKVGGATRHNRDTTSIRKACDIHDQSDTAIPKQRRATVNGQMSQRKRQWFDHYFLGVENAINRQSEYAILSAEDHDGEGQILVIPPFPAFVP
jgi:hypothetical protein